MQDNNTSTHSSQANFAHTHFAGNSLTQNSVGKSIGFLENSWILDTGASNHMCNDLRLLRDIWIIKPPI